MIEDKNRFSILIFISSIIIPFIGLIYVLIVRNKNIGRARSALYGSLIGIVVWIIYGILR